MKSIFAAVVMVLSANAFAAEQVDLTEEEFKMYRHYKLASEDPRVQAMKPAARVPAIAKDAGYKVKDLEKAISKGDAAGDVKAKCEANLKEVMGSSSLNGRVAKMEIDTSAEHAVAYVQWMNEEPKNALAEACVAANRAAESCPIISTIQVWANAKTSPKTRVFQALISAAGAKRIKPDQVADLAETRYVKLFEKIKNAANGDDLSAEVGVPSGK